MKTQNTQENSNAQHTPGPWHANENGHARNKFGEPQWTVGPTFHCLATVHKRDDDPAQMIADARLIASAPELLAALEGLLTGIRASDNQKLFDLLCAELQDAEQAIAKAKGGAL